MQLALGILFYISLSLLNELWYLPTRFYEHCFERRKGFTEATNCGFFCFQIIVFFQKLIT